LRQGINITDLVRQLLVPDGETYAFSQRLLATWDRRDNAFNATRGTYVVTGIEHVDAFPTDVNLQNARDRGLTNFEIRVMDGENPDLPSESFDAVLSRLGLIYFPDREGALRAAYRLLKAGGRVVLASFSTPDQNRFFSIPISIIRRRAQLPPPAPGLPGPFSLGAPGVMESALSAAGFKDVTVNAVQTPLRLSSAAECVRFERESFGALQQMLASLPDADREAAWSEIEHELGVFETDGGFRAGTELIVGSGTKVS
jgi:SAM-dependent methyltransferase